MDSIGAQRLTANGAVGTSGADIRIFGIAVRAGAGGDTVVHLRNGTADTAAIWDSFDAAASTTTRVKYPGGLLLVGGAYIDLDADANTSFVTVTYQHNQ